MPVSVYALQHSPGRNSGVLPARWSNRMWIKFTVLSSWMIRKIILFLFVLFVICVFKSTFLEYRFPFFELLKWMFLMLIAMSSDRPQTRWPRHPCANQGHPERLCRGRGCDGRTDGASHLLVWLAAPCPLLMATWRTAGCIQPAGQRGAQHSDFLN